MRTYELVLNETHGQDQHQELFDALVERSRVRSLTISSLDMWSCSANGLLHLLFDCATLVELELKNMELTPDFMTMLEQGLQAPPVRDTSLKEQCYNKKVPLAALGRLLTAVSTRLRVVHLPFDVRLRKPEGVTEFLDHVAQLSQLQSLKLNGTEFTECCTIRSFKANLLVKLAEDCHVLHEVSGVNFGKEVKVSKVDLEYRLQLNRYGRRWVDSPTFPPALWAKVLAKATRDGALDACRFLLRRVALIVPQQGRKRSPSSPADPLNNEGIVRRGNSPA